MTDLAKVPYLVGNGKNQKLKRNVPALLQSAAGRTAWIKRIANLPAGEAKVRAHNFAVYTDGELHRLRAKVGSAAGLGTGLKSLDASRISQIVNAYFRRTDERNLLSGSYVAPQDEETRQDAIENASIDLQHAHAHASGEQLLFDRPLIDLLLHEGIISLSTSDQLHRVDRSQDPTLGGWPIEFTDSPELRKLQLAIAQADLEIAGRRYESLTGGQLASVRNDVFRVAASAQTQTAPKADLHASSSSKTVGDLEAAFIATQEGRVTGSTLAQYRLPFRVLLEKFDPTYPLSDITREHCRSIVAFLPTIPAHATQLYKGFKLAAAAAKAAAATTPAQSRPEEASKHLRVLKRLFRFAVDEGWISLNPFQGLAITVPREQQKKHLDKAATYNPFAIDQLNRLFALPLFTGCINDENGCHKPGPHLFRRHRYWAPIIGLWTGMRMNEILQLEREDIEEVAGGIHVITVTDKVYGTYPPGIYSKRVKTKGAIREIPVHPFLLELGFIDWVRARAGRLFPEATIGNSEKMSDLYSKRFRSNTKAAGISSGRRFVFHSFRNNFNDAMRKAGVSLELRVAIQGWSDSQSMDQRYGEGFGVQQKYEALKSVRYDGLKVEHLLTAARLVADAPPLKARRARPLTRSPRVSKRSERKPKTPPVS